MHIDLSGNSAIVTGSTGGIGQAIAAGLATAGAHVVIVGRTQDSIDLALRNIGSADARGISLRPAQALRYSRRGRSNKRLCRVAPGQRHHRCCVAG